jgi:hypothetical protein
MTTMAKRVGVAVALVVTLVGGWLWGVHGGWDPDRARLAAQVRSDLLRAHVSLLAARVDLDDADFRDMRRHLEDARGFADRAGVRLDDLGWKDEARRLDLAGFGAEIEAAERLGARLDRRARARAIEAAATIEEVRRWPRLPLPELSAWSPRGNGNRELEERR